MAATDTKRRPAPARTGIRVLDTVARSAALALLARVSGRLTVIDSQGAHVLGDGGAGADLSATVHVHSPAAYRGVFGGSRGIARAYAEGHWDCDDIVSLVRIAARSLPAIDPWRLRLSTVLHPFLKLRAMARANTRARSVDNIMRHYDLGNDFFALVLDETMMYSCAYWEDPDMAPVEASRANLERVCRILDLRRGDRLLEIGSGWGGLAIHAARRFGAQVTAITISPSQRDYAIAAAQRAGVGDRVDVLLRDYRDLRGRWDKLVSIEMVEAVGALQLDALMEKCGQLLRPDGLMLMQAITSSDTLYRTDRYHRTFLNDIIFPGGFVPSVESIIDASARRSDLRVAAVYDITPHYPWTLRAWRARLLRNWSRIEALGGFDERFRRLWTLYMSWCEAGFHERRVQDRQIVLAGPQWRDENRLLGLYAAETEGTLTASWQGSRLTAVPG